MKKKTETYWSNSKRRVKREPGTSIRLALISFFCIAAFGLLLAKLVKVQVIEHEYYSERAKENILKRRTIPALRGSIYDRQGRELARDVIQYSVAVSEKYAANKQKVVNYVSRTLGISSRWIQKQMKKNPTFTYIAHKISAEKAEVLAKLKDPGIILEKRFQRVYPYKFNGAHFVGFCNVDNKGLGGVEFQYNHYLEGKPGWKIFLQDAYGNQLINLDFSGEDPIDGMDVVLTVDMEYQEILSDELRKAVEKSQAKEGVAILVNPNNGEILGIANYPQFDPNNPNLYTDEQRKNVLLSAALENLNVDLDKSIYFCHNGVFWLYGRKIEDYKKFGWLTLRKVIENSSNIGTMQVMQDLDKKIFYRYVRNFGFGMITGVDLPGESAGILQPLDSFSQTTPYYMSIGYEIGVTPLQLCMAYAAIANGGVLYKPYILKQVIGPNRKVVKENQPEVVRQVISPETAQLITSTLVGVVKDGTGKKAFLEEVTIAGKTGTAQLYNPELGRYDSRQHVASFVGYFPAENPQFTLLVMIRQPKGVYYGGLVAAPAFRKMASRLMSIAHLRHEGFALQEEEVFTASGQVVPIVEKLKVEIANKILKNKGFDVELVGNGSIVESQEVVRKGGKVACVRLITKEKSTDDLLVMPSLRGLTLKEALSVLGDFQIVPLVEGHGIVVQQSPKPGTRIDDKKLVKLVCKPS